MSQFTWVPLFKEIASWLIGYRARQKELVKILLDIGIEVGVSDKNAAKEKIPLENIDPFTFYALFTKFGDDKRSEFFEALIDSQGLESEVPIDFMGVPKANAQKVWLFPYAYEREDWMIDTLWDLFEAVHNHEDEEKYFNKALEVPHTGFTKLTECLFYCAPERYFPVDGQTRPWLERHNLNNPSQNWESYNKLLTSIKAKTDKTFYEISYEAWRYNRSGQVESKAFDINSAAELLKKWIPVEPKKTKYVLAFNWKGKDIALALSRSNTVKLFISYLPKSLNLESEYYSPDRGRNSNLKSNAPSLAKGKPAYYVTVKSAEELRELVNTYFSHNQVEEDSPTYKRDENVNQNPLNQVLYGPPGTGKTYLTTEEAVRIAEPDWFNSLIEKRLDPEEYREQLKQKYDNLVKEQRIAFTTFHQSFSYEDFVEGIRASSSEDGTGVKYEVEDGVFKVISDLAKASLNPGVSKGLNITGRNIWKMSLGNTQKSEDDIYQDCIERGLVRLGYGWDVDFSGCSSKKDIIERYKDVRNIVFSTTSYEVTSVNTFINKMSNGDLIIVSDGNSKFRAIGEVVGDYELLEDDDLQGFCQARKVNWLRVFEPSITSSVLFNRSLSQMTLYQVKPQIINHDKLAEYLSDGNENSSPKNHVIVIDEINRGNISRIFGELITLLEKDKRIGGSDERTVILPYSKKSFSVPSNLYVLGTMNTADKSLAQLDLALRRRFEFKEMLPDPELLRDVNVYGVNISELLTIMNQRIEILLDRDHLIGHSYFWSLKDLGNKEESEAELSTIFQNKVIPLLQEYFFSDWERISWVLNDVDKADKTERFIHLSEDLDRLSGIFSDKVVSEVSDRRYQINHNAFSNPRAYQGIIKKLDSEE